MPSGLAALGIAGCVACCALPLLVSAGVLTGAGAAVLADWLPGLALALVVAAGATWWWTAHRPGCSSCGGTSDATAEGGGCTCGPAGHADRGRVGSRTVGG